jgi:hypothetical protein
MTDRRPEDRVNELLNQYELYDRHVDVVSAFEWLFTATEKLPETVTHFERFPRIPIARGVSLTPDFTVLFKDGTALVGEIAQIAVNDNSVEKLCKQLAGYAELTEVPGIDSMRSVTELDVLAITQLKTGPTMVQRVIEDRLKSSDHWYAPQRSPCIVQYGRDGGVYSFQRLPHQHNGSLLSPSSRTPNVNSYLTNTLSVKAELFVGVKASRAFINDPIPPLYLATHLWLKTWPSSFGGQSTFQVTVGDTCDQIQREFGTGRRTDVQAALAVLRDAGLAHPIEGGSWQIAHRQLGVRGNRDVHALIAERSSAKRVPVAKRRSPGRSDLQNPLF